MAQYEITSGGREHIVDATTVLSEAFEDDPTVTYTLPTMSKEQRLAFLPKYFLSLVTSAAMDNASIDGIDNWKSCGILIPPGSHYDNTLAMIQAGFLSVLWAAGIEGCRVSANSFTPKNSVRPID